MDATRNAGWTKNAGRRSRALGLALALLIPLGCDDPSTGPGSDGPTQGVGTLSVYLTDAPGEVANVWVEVVDVVLVGGEGGPVSLLDEPTELINLLELRDTQVALTEEHEIDPGTYQQVRFVIGGAVLETVGGDVYVRGGAEHPEDPEATATGTLQCPSCAQTGIKVRVPGSLELTEGENGLLLDFDVAESFGRQAGQSGMWVMRPTIQGVLAAPPEIENGGVGGDIVGTVVLATEEGVPITLAECGGEERGLSDFVPVATALALEDDEGTPLHFTGETDEDGSFRIGVLAEDEYALGYWEEVVLNGETLVWSAEVEPATVEAGDQDEVGGVTFTITDTGCQEN